MNRDGTPEPIAPATTPHASSGWSRRACSTIASWIVRLRRSTLTTLAGASPAGQGLDQRLLDVRQVVVDGQFGRARRARVAAQLLVELGRRVGVVGDLQPGAEQDAH